MVRRITAVALVVGTLGAAATAEAVVRAGFYSGQTAQQADVSLSEQGDIPWSARRQRR